MKSINITILVIVSYTVYSFFLYYQYFNSDYNDDKIVINERKIYSTYKNEICGGISESSNQIYTKKHIFQRKLEYIDLMI